MVGHHHSAWTSSSRDKGSQPMEQGDKRATARKEEGKAICVATTSFGSVRRSKARRKCQYMKRATFTQATSKVQKQEQRWTDEG